MRRGAACFALLAALALGTNASPLHARQRASASAVILGTVGDTGLHPIARADVAFAGSKVHATSDSLGQFRIVDIPAGRYVLFTRAIGYRPATNLVEVSNGDTLRLAFTLDPVVHEITGITVTERKLSPKLQQFEERRKLGFGEFITQADIEAMNPVGIRDVLRRTKSVRLSPNGDRALSAREVSICPMAIYLDGIALAFGGTDLYHMPSPKEIAAIEVYAGSATLPVWLPGATIGTRKGCGAILVWTRDGS